MTRGEITGRECSPVVPLVDSIGEGECVLTPWRSGGSFDPLGTRLVDVNRADDLAAVTASLGGRWCLITLTVDRALFTDPEAAYQRCNEYVRKAITAGCPRGVFVSCFEVQGKTGDGWPHWHALAWCPDGRSTVEIKADVLRAWRTTAEHVDRETGEVTYSRERIGFVDVEAAESNVACGKYVGKYLMKPWPAVPSWMLQSRRRFRKLRASSGLYLVLERLHRHSPSLGRRPVVKGTGRRTRRLIDRLVRSGSALSVFRRVNGALKHVGVVPVHVRDIEAFAGETARAVRLGQWRRVRVALSWEEFQRRRSSVLGDFVRQRWDRMQADRDWIEAAWSLHQQERAEGGDDDVSGVG